MKSVIFNAFLAAEIIGCYLLKLRKGKCEKFVGTLNCFKVTTSVSSCIVILQV